MRREYIEKSTRYRILKRQNFKCAICGKKLKYNINSSFGEEVAHIDHIHPISKSDSFPGNYVGRLDNLQALCPGCNISKGDKVQYYCFQCGKPLDHSFLIDGKEKEVIYICHSKGGCGTFFSKEQIEDKENWMWYNNENKRRVSGVRKPKEIIQEGDMDDDSYYRERI